MKDENSDKKNISTYCFRFLIRKQYPSVDISNEDLDILCFEFNEYLHSLNLSNKARINIYPENETEVIMNMDNPLRINGFQPALLVHFYDFIEKSISKQN